MERRIKHFNEHMKVRICHSDKSRMKHEVIKTICVMLIKNKYKSKAEKIYTEYPVGKRIADVYFELDNDKYVIEIQKNMANDYQKKTELYYLYFDITPIIIQIKEMPDELNELWDEIKNII